MHALPAVIAEALTILGFMYFILIFIEFVNYRLQGKLIHIFSKNNFWVNLLLPGLGLLPGCFGSFAAVSMFTHGAINFGGLTGVMVATIGDEFFVLLHQAPATAPGLLIFLVALAVLTSLALNHRILGFLGLNKQKICGELQHTHTHTHPQPTNANKARWQLALLIPALLLVAWGLHQLGHGHMHHGHHGDSQFIILALLGALAMAALLATPPSMAQKMRTHVVIGHLPRIFIWTLGALLVLELIHIEGHQWLTKMGLPMLFGVALLIGLIPQSGPHIVFILLFAQGAVPFSVLLANSIVQDGHGLLPLLARSRRAFFMVKLVKVVLALLVAGSLALLGV